MKVKGSTCWLFQVCVTLTLLGGNDFLRMGGLAGGLSTTLMHKTMHHVVRIINTELKDEFLKFPTSQQLRENAESNFQKYHLPSFGYAVDGCHFYFKEKPRGLPDGKIKFFCLSSNISVS